MKPITITVYRQRFSRQWRWRAVAPNGRKLANGGEAYKNASDAISAIRALFRSAEVVCRYEGQSSAWVVRPQ